MGKLHETSIPVYQWSRDRNLIGVASAFSLPYLVGLAWLASMKIQHDVPCCTWGRVVKMPRETEKFHAFLADLRKQSSVVDRDEQWGMVKVHTPFHDFWVKKQGTDMDGFALATYLVAEQHWVHELRPDWQVKQGETVADLGAHIGVFTATALAAGAKQVIAVEPDPTNIECLKRNFSAEISSGRVVLVPEGAWSSEQDIDFEIGETNSGTGSMVLETGQKKIKVHVRPLDDMLSRARVARLDFIKMDIEGAEREAMKGAGSAIRRDHPRMFLDAYHRPDDPEVLPQVARQFDAAYDVDWGPCMANQDKHMIVPHSMLIHDRR